MSSIEESSSSLMDCTTVKPVVVRVKRKSCQSRLDAFWLEINERPSKRPLLDFQKLSIGGESAHGKVEELKRRKVFVHHVETISSSEATVDVLQSFAPYSGDVVDGIPKSKEQRETLKKDNILAQSARFEQIRRTHRGNKEISHDKALQEACHFYDVVRVDVEERSNKMHEEVMSLEDQRLLSSYLPLLREFIPSAADDIESDIHDYMSKPDDYVYDYYTVSDAMELDDEESLSAFPLVKVEEEEDFYDGPDDESEYESDDSNAEAHPRNEYPDESSQEEDEEESEELSNIEEEEEEEEEEEDVSSGPSEFKELRHHLCENEVSLHEDEIYDGDCTFDNEDDINFGYDNDDDCGDYGEGRR